MSRKRSISGVAAPRNSAVFGHRDRGCCARRSAALAARQQRSLAELDALKAFLERELVRISGKRTLVQAIRYALWRWDALTRFTTDGRLEMTNNAAERAIRPLALGRKNWLFAGSDTGGERAAMIYTIIETARLNGLDPYAYLADLLGRIGEHPINRITELLPWHRRPAQPQAQAA